MRAFLLCGLGAAMGAHPVHYPVTHPCAAGMSDHSAGYPIEPARRPVLRCACAPQHAFGQGLGEESDDAHVGTAIRTHQR